MQRCFRLLSPLLFVLLLAGCINKSKTIKSGSGEVDSGVLAASADGIFASRMHTESNIREAFTLIDRAARSASQDDPRRYEYIWKAMRLVTWLSDHDKDSKQRSEYANEGIQLGNTAVKLKEDGVEGHYYRAISIGLYARENELYGLDAMRQMQTEGLRAAELDERFDFAGPYRLLGALYLRAPGPPTGVGSVIKAIHYLKKACELAPEYPPNSLFLAEAYIKNNQSSDADTLLTKLLQEPFNNGDDLEKEEWKKEAATLQSKIQLTR